MIFQSWLFCFIFKFHLLSLCSCISGNLMPSAKSTAGWSKCKAHNFCLHSFVCLKNLSTTISRGALFFLLFVLIEFVITCWQILKMHIGQSLVGWIICVYVCLKDIGLQLAVSLIVLGFTAMFCWARHNVLITTVIARFYKKCGWFWPFFMLFLLGKIFDVLLFSSIS